MHAKTFFEASVEDFAFLSPPVDPVGPLTMTLQRPQRPAPPQTESIITPLSSAASSMVVPGDTFILMPSGSKRTVHSPFIRFDFVISLSVIALY
jgi:hypothetical protein